MRWRGRQAGRLGAVSSWAAQQAGWRPQTQGIVPRCRPATHRSIAIVQLQLLLWCEGWAQYGGWWVSPRCQYLAGTRAAGRCNEAAWLRRPLPAVCHQQRVPRRPSACAMTRHACPMPSFSPPASGAHLHPDKQLLQGGNQVLLARPAPLDGRSVSLGCGWEMEVASGPNWGTAGRLRRPACRSTHAAGGGQNPSSIAELRRACPACQAATGSPKLRRKKASSAM